MKINKLSVFAISTYVVFVLASVKFENQIIGIKNELKTVKEELQQIKQSLPVNYQKVTLTAYHPPSKGINADKDPNSTATMTRPIPGRTLAISKPLVKLGWLGKQIYIEGWGVGRATDRMGASIKDVRIDVCAPSLQYAKQFGIKRDVLAVVLD